jgi:hypothetical protein
VGHPLKTMSKDKLPSDKELVRLTESKTIEDKLKDALLHLMFSKHAFDPVACSGCKEAKHLVS